MAPPAWHAMLVVLAFVIIVSAKANAAVVTSSILSTTSSFSPVYFSIDNKNSKNTAFANHTWIQEEKVFLVKTNHHPISVLLPPKKSSKSGNPQLQKVSTQVKNVQGRRRRRCRTVATNGGPFNADGSCVGPVIMDEQVIQNATSNWPGFGRGFYKTDYSGTNGMFYVLGKYSDILKQQQQQQQQSEIQLVDFVTGFGWLVYDGKISVNDDNDENPTGAVQAPRTVLGVDENNHWIFLVADGCEKCVPPYHRGMTLTEVAKVLVDQAGAKYAINLDGGGSSTMVVDGKVVNRPMCLDVVPVKCQRRVATVICVDAPDTSSSSSSGNNSTLQSRQSPPKPP